MLAINTNPISANPYSAPALVDWTKWVTPIAVVANKIPGPKILKNLVVNKKS